MYSRFKALKDFGEDELQSLKGSKASVVGLGATGSIIAEHLARHGVKLMLVDRDYLEPKDAYSSNIYSPEDCKNAEPKAKAAERELEKFTEVECETVSLDPDNTSILADSDIVLDGTDNLYTRFLIDEFCRRDDIPWVYTSALGKEGYSMFFDRKCFSCIFEDSEAGTLGTCETDGIMRETASIVGSMSSMKAVKYLAGKEVEETMQTASGEIFNFESQGCEVCREQNFPHLNGRRETVSLCGEDKYQIHREAGEQALERLRELGDVIAENDHLVRAKVNEREITVFRSGRIYVEAEDEGAAKSSVSEILGV